MGPDLEPLGTNGCIPATVVCPAAICLLQQLHVRNPMGFLTNSSIFDSGQGLVSTFALRSENLQEFCKSKGSDDDLKKTLENVYKEHVKENVVSPHVKERIDGEVQFLRNC